LGAREYDEVAANKYKLQDNLQEISKEQKEEKSEHIKTEQSDVKNEDKTLRKTFINPMRELYNQNGEKSDDYKQIWLEQKELRRMHNEDK